jgi:hypothetical protein
MVSREFCIGSHLTRIFTAFSEDSRMIYPPANEGGPSINFRGAHVLERGMRSNVRAGLRLFRSGKSQQAGLGSILCWHQVACFSSLLKKASEPVIASEARNSSSPKAYKK